MFNPITQIIKSAIIFSIKRLCLQPQTLRIGCIGNCIRQHGIQISKTQFEKTCIIIIWQNQDVECQDHLIPVFFKA